MKTGILLLLMMPFACFAQEKEKNCVLEAKEIDSLIKAVDYDNAYAILQKTKCTSETHYLAYENVLTHRLAAPTTEVEKQNFLDALLKLYTDDDKNFPGNKHGNLVKRAKTLQSYQADSGDAIFKLFDAAFTNDRENFTDVRGLYDYFELYFEKFKAGEKNFSEENLIDKQDEIIGRIAALAKKDATEKRNFNTAINGIRALTNPVVSCQKLETHYDAQLAKRKSDANWLETATENLISKNCMATPTATNLASAWYGLQPDAASAYAMGVVSLRSRENQSKAVDYFNQAAEKEQDIAKKSEIFLTLASIFTSSDVQKAIGFARKAIELRPDYGKPYLLLAQLYVSTSCGETPFEKKALYQLASETVLKSAVVDRSMKKSAEIVSAKYLKKAPTRDEVKKAKMAGKSVSFACGINQSVTFPK